LALDHLVADCRGCGRSGHCFHLCPDRRLRHSASMPGVPLRSGPSGDWSPPTLRPPSHTRRPLRRLRRRWSRSSPLCTGDCAGPYSGSCA
jgi:hypothetical protein